MNTSLNNPEAGKEKIGDRYIFRMFARFLAPYTRQILIVFAGLLVVTALTVILPYLIQLTVDGPIANRQLDQVAPIGIAYFTIVLVIFAVRAGSIYLLQTVGQSALHDLRRTLFAHILRQDMRYFNNTPVGQLVSRMSNDIEALTELLSTSFVMVVSNLLTLIGVVLAMLAINWRLALVSFIVLPVMIFMTTYFRRLLREASSRYHQVVAETLAYINEQFGGMLIVQLFNRQPVSRAGFREKNDQYVEVHSKLRDYYTWYASILQLLTTIGLSIVLFGGGQGVLAGWATIGMLIAFIEYTRRMFEPIMNLTEQIAQIQTALSAGERIARMLRVEPEVIAPADPSTVEPNVPLTVDFDHVTFSYDEGHPVIQDMTLHIPAGQTLAIVGATGAGKTSLAGLVGRFYDVDSGSVRVAGQDVRDLSDADLRSRVTIVPQNPYCFTGTIAENIALFDPDIPRERVIQAARTACAHRFIEKLPEGYDTMLLPAGANLSQGQRQLIALARALLHHPHSILVLDEATSSIDTETEEAIQDGLKQVLRGRTSIVIAHRLSTVREVDRILVMSQGVIVEQGTHEELLAMGGMYAALVRRQFVEYADAEGEAA